MELGKQKNKVLDIVIIGIGVLIAFNIYKGQMKELEALKSTKENETKKNAVLKDISKVDKNINNYKKMLTKKDPGKVMDTVSGIAKQSGVKILSIKPLPDQVSQDFVKTPFNLVISVPSYHSIGKFISRLESEPDVYVVDAVEIKTGAETEQGGQMMKRVKAEEEMSVSIKLSVLSIP